MELLWLDLETTGLEPSRDSILEVAWAFATIDRPFEVPRVIERVRSAPFAPITSEFVRDMHTKNGLLEACLAGGWDLATIERHILVDVDDLHVLAGSSVHFDLGFLRVHMPALAARLSHRCFDVTAIALFCQSLGMPRPPKAEAHRAAADVRESIAIAQSCAEWLGFEKNRIEQLERDLATCRAALEGASSIGEVAFEALATCRAALEGAAVTTNSSGEQE